MSETHCRADRLFSPDPVPGYKVWCSERSGGDKGGGGLALYYKDCLTAHQWTPPVSPAQQYIEKERQWLLLGDRIAFLHIYVACQNHRDDSYLQLNESLFSLVTQEAIMLRRRGFCCLAMGDFNTRVGVMPGLEDNTPDRNSNYPAFMDFLKQVNLTIINTLPQSRGLFTRFMDNTNRPGTKSLLDYGLIDHDHVNTVTSFVIDEDARYEAGSDHALLECNIELGNRPTLSWSFDEAVHYNVKACTDYSKYLALLETTVSSIPLHTFSDLPSTEMLPHISESINSSARNTLGLKVKQKRTGRKLPMKIVKMIRAKNQYSRDLAATRSGSSPGVVGDMERHLDHLKSCIRDEISGVKLQRRHHIRSKVLKADPSRKRFWRFLKSQIKSAGNISAAYDKAGTMVFEQPAIEEAILDFFEDVFKGQRVPVFPSSTYPSSSQSQANQALQDMDVILRNVSPCFIPDKFEDQVCPPFTMFELAEELDHLPDGKASGYDSIPNELLKNSGSSFRSYLHIFLNKVMDEGVVPEDLNLGKCVLVHKVKL